MINDTSKDKLDYHQEWLKPYMFTTDTLWELTIVIIWRGGSDWLPQLVTMSHFL
jgi:hypothetical protein